jgi:hypothetical protein
MPELWKHIEDAEVIGDGSSAVTSASLKLYDSFKPTAKNELQISKISGSVPLAYLLETPTKRYRITNQCYQIICLMDGRRSLRDIAALLPNNITVEQLARLISADFVKMGIIEGTKFDTTRVISLLYWKKILFSDVHLAGFARRSTFLFSLPVCLLFLILGLSVYAYGIIAVLVRNEFEIIHFLKPEATLYIIAGILICISSFIHEIGHYACYKKYCPDCNGGIGIGIYFIAPVFFADLNGIWGLDVKKKSRSILREFIYRIYS